MKRLMALIVLLLAGFYGGWPAFSAYQIHKGLKTGNTARVANKIDFESLRTSLRPTVERETDKAVTQALAKAGPTAGTLGPGFKQQIMPKLVDQALATLVTPEVMIRIYREGGNVTDSVKRIIAEQAGAMGGLAGLGNGLGSIGEMIGTAASGSGASPGKLGGLGGVGALADKLGGGNGLGGLFGSKKKADTQQAEKKPELDEAGAPAGAAPAPSYGLANIKGFGFDGPLGLKLGVAKDPAAADADVTAHMAFTGGDWKLVGLVPRTR